MPRSLRKLFFFIIAGGLLLVVLNILNSETGSEQIKYSEFVKAVESGKVSSVILKGDKITGKFKAPVALKDISETKDLPDAIKDKKLEAFKTLFRSNVDPSPEKILIDNKVETEIQENDETDWWLIILQVLPILILLFFFIPFFHNMNAAGGQAMQFGRSRHRSVTSEKNKVTFADVAGVEEAKEELTEIVDYLKAPRKYQSLGARIPKGVLLLGSPGTGKTLLGKAVAGEADVPFYFISGSDFVEMYVGVGASRVRDLFEQAKKTAPCIIFMDEIDAVGRQRGAGLGGGNDEREQTLNQLLVEMDGFDATPDAPAVIVLAATNRPDVLDPALLRPGRFDRQVIVDRPDIEGRLAILKVHSRGKPISPEVDLRELAQRTPGFSGADLENLLNEAALLAARNDKTVIEMCDCTEAIDRVTMGPERKSRIISKKDREVTAYHESGHALVARNIPEADPVRKITILPRGQALGVTSLVPDKDRYNMTKAEILASICVFMGGRAAEELTFNEITTGASNDIERATSMARDMVCRYGMSAKIGPIHFGRKQSQVFLGRDIVEDRNFSNDTANMIDEEVSEIIASCYKRAKDILTEHADQLDKLTALLMEKEIVEASVLDDLLGPSAAELKKREEEPEEAENADKNAEDNAAGSDDSAEDNAGNSAPDGQASEKETAGAKDSDDGSDDLSAEQNSDIS